MNKEFIYGGRRLGKSSIITHGREYIIRHKLNASIVVGGTIERYVSGQLVSCDKLPKITGAVATTVFYNEFGRYKK